MIFIDIDNFRDFNNGFGHKVGDQTLCKVGQIIKSFVRIGDKVFRYGGEEIVVTLTDCNKANALKLAEKIRGGVSSLDNDPYPKVTVSLGISSYPEDGKTVEEILEKSDRALLIAKEQGKNRSIEYIDGF